MLECFTLQEQENYTKDVKDGPIMKFVLVLLFLTAVGAEEAETFTDVSAKLIGRSIYLESLDRRGAWLSKTHSRVNNDEDYEYLSFKGSLEEKIYFSEWGRFKVIDCGNGFVCVQSDYANSTFWVHSSTKYLVIRSLLTTVSYHPQSNEALKFRFECTNEKFERCRIKVATFPLYFTIFGKDTEIEKSVVIPWTDDFKPTSRQRFRILAPLGTCDLMDIHPPIENNGPTPITKEVTHSEGVESTTESSFDLTAGMSASITAGFGAFEASVEASVETAMHEAMSATNSNSVEKKMTYIIPKYSKYVIKQQVGNYGPFRVRTGKIVILCTDIKTGSPCIDVRDSKKKKKVKA